MPRNALRRFNGDGLPCLILSRRVSTIPMGRQIDEKRRGSPCYRENRKKSYSLYTIGESDLGARLKAHTHTYTNKRNEKDRIFRKREKMSYWEKQAVDRESRNTGHFFKREPPNKQNYGRSTTFGWRKPSVSKLEPTKYLKIVPKTDFRSYGTNAGGPANAGGAPSSSRKMQATKAQVDEVSFFLLLLLLFQNCNQKFDQVSAYSQ